MKQWANLDFLRSVAVLLVVYAHTLLYRGRPDLIGWAGIIGVCFFFVHTSLVLMWSLERDSHVGRFYLRRIFRIYPLWIAVFFLVIALHIPISPSFSPQFGYQSSLPKDVLLQVLLLFNLFPTPQVVGASWSLPLEVDMYLLLPCLFFFLRGAQKLWPLFVLMGFVMLWDVRYYAPYPSAFPMCIPYFFGGLIAYVRTKQVRPTLPGWAFPVFLAALIAVAFHHTTYRRNWIVCLVLGLAIPYFRQMTWKPIVIASHYVAKYSYGVYLGHFIAIAAGFYYLDGHGLAARLTVYFLTLFILPVVFYHVVEEPMIRLGSGLAKRIEDGPSPPLNEETLHLEPAP